MAKAAVPSGSGFRAQRGQRPAPRGHSLHALLLSGLVTAALIAPSLARAEIFPRISAAEGTVVARKTGEEAQFVDLPSWRPVDVDQNLLAGDTLRTNAAGNLTIRFADKSIVRMGRNTTMLVKKISSETDSILRLQEGTIWARAARGGSKVEVDTPAATAAIRGTDWTLQVSGNRTTLTVLEGSVELANGQGSVVVNQGEGATVTIGQAPRKYILVNLREREQILLYNELRDVFTELSPSGMDGTRARAERRRILATDAGARSAEDWLALAETSLGLADRKAVRAALSHLKRPLGPTAEARAKLVEALLAGQEMRYAEAAGLLSAALPHLPHDRRATAAYSLWFARSLAEPGKALPPPDPAAFADDPAAALARAEAVAHLEGPAAAIDGLAAAEKRFPRDARLPAARAALAFQLDRRDEVQEALARARALDPDDPSSLLTSAQYRTTVSSDVDGALAELQHAAAIAPGDSAIWNEIGLVQSERNAIVEADRAHRKAITVNPENAVVRANYARFLMDYDQLTAARHQLDVAEALDPEGYAVLAAKGRYLLKMGKTAEGEKALLDAAAVNPTYGDALVGLAIATYQQGATEETMQALDNADRFDPNNPSISLLRAGIAIDEFRADEAIIQAREALRRREARGGYYSGYDVNRQALSYLGIALDNLGMTEWGQYYADRSADPFKASTYYDEADGGTATPFVNLPPSGLERFASGNAQSSLFQGSLLDPLSISGEDKRNGLERRNFVEASLRGDLLTEGAGPGWGTYASLQGTSYAGIPMSYLLEGSLTRPRSERENDDFDGGFGSFRLGLRPTLTDSVVLFGDRNVSASHYPGQTFDPTPFDRSRSVIDTLAGAWSHTIEERNVIQAYVANSRDDTRLHLNYADQDLDLDRHFVDETLSGGINHMLGLGPLTLRYGAEMAELDSRFAEKSRNTADGTVDRFRYSGDTTATRSYLDATLDLSRDLEFQAGAYRTRYDGDAPPWGPIDYRLGAAWAPLDGQWLRAFYRRDTRFLSDYTLSPISTVGLVPMDTNVVTGGQLETATLRWDSEWNERLFTAVEYQHQRFSGLGLQYDDSYAFPATTDGTIDRLTFSGNYWFGGGLGGFASLSLYDSEDTKGFWKGYDVPLVPDYLAQAGLKYVHPSRVTVTLAQNFVGERLGAQDSRVTEDGVPYPIFGYLKPYTTTDAALGWKSLSGSLEFNLTVNNIFDRRIQSAVGIPAPGRTVWASLTARY
jgi:Tfp pilus assembly protein PilF